MITITPNDYQTLPSYEQSLIRHFLQQFGIALNSCTEIREISTGTFITVLLVDPKTYQHYVDPDDPTQPAKREDFYPGKHLPARVKRALPRPRK